MRILRKRNGPRGRPLTNAGFTLIEVIIAAGIMVILCVGTLSVFSHASKINSGNNLRSQAQSVLQLRTEYYRSLKFTPSQTDAQLLAGTYNLGQATSADGQLFNTSATVTNVSYSYPGTTTDEAHCVFKQIVISATPVTVQTGWLSSLNAGLSVTIQRVRAN
jgi:prepilin-type N-terminal cleavage/methylation domain-containing protein